MKKILSYFAIVVLTICLVGFALEQIAPASTVHAASEPRPELTSTDPIEEEAIPLARSQPAVFVVTGLVCVLFGVIAVSPLLIEDPAQGLRRDEILMNFDKQDR